MNKNTKACYVCNGKGWLVCPGCDGKYKTCAKCKGKGKVNCPRCG